jgi:RNA polymerase sigma-70 factor (ECF subfamily)
MAQPSVETIRLAQTGDEEALTELVMSQQNYVYSIAMGIFRNPEDAADAAQDAFLHLFRVLPSYRGETRFTTWLYRVVVNLCYDELRRRKRRPAPTEDGEETLARMRETAAWADPEQDATRAETQARVRAALGQLDEPYRLPLILYYFEELKYREIAEITGLPLNTVKSHIFRGKARLARILTGPADAEEDTASAPRVPDSSDRERVSQLPLAMIAGQTR